MPKNYIRFTASKVRFRGRFVEVAPCRQDRFERSCSCLAFLAVSPGIEALRLVITISMGSSFDCVTPVECSYSQPALTRNPCILVKKFFNGQFRYSIVIGPPTWTWTPISPLRVRLGFVVNGDAHQMSVHAVH